MQLPLRLVGVFIGDLSKLLAGGIGIRTAPVWVVQEVESLGAEGNVLLFRDVEILEDGSIPVLEAGVVELVPALLRGEGAWRGRSYVGCCSGLGKCACGRNKGVPEFLLGVAADVLVGELCCLRRIPGDNPAGTLALTVSATCAYTAEVITGLDGERRTGLELDYSRNLKTT